MAGSWAGQWGVGKRNNVILGGLNGQKSEFCGDWKRCSPGWGCISSLLHGFYWWAPVDRRSAGSAWSPAGAPGNRCPCTAHPGERKNNPPPQKKGLFGGHFLHDIKMRQKTRILGIVQVGFGVARRCFLMDAHRFPILESRFRIEKSSKICCSGGNSDLGAKNHQNCANLHWNTSIYSVLHFWHSSLRNLTLIIWKMRAGFN